MSRVTSLAEAVSLVEDGSHVALGGFAITRNSMAVVHEIVRAGRRDLTLSQVIGGMDTDVLVGAGAVAHLTYSGGSLDRFGFLHGLNAAVLARKVVAREYSSLALTLRFHAGAMGMPFASCKSVLGSDLLAPLRESGEVRVMDDPFTGEPAVVLPPLCPDVAFVHADVADERGNAVVSGPTWTIRETAFAARRVVVTAEEIVPTGDLDADHVLVPAAIVNAVVEVPRGAHPTAVLGRYDYDREHLTEYAAMARAGLDGVAAYVEKYVLGVGGHSEYLDLVGRAA